MKQFIKDPSKYLPYMFRFELRNGSREISRKIINEYLGSRRELDLQLMEQVSDPALSDMLMDG